jgi:hypothetical protein
MESSLTSFLSSPNACKMLSKEGKSPMTPCRGRANDCQRRGGALVSPMNNRPDMKPPPRRKRRRRRRICVHLVCLSTLYRDGSMEDSPWTYQSISRVGNIPI